MPNAQYLEILVLAVVAAVILFRLYTVLGRRTGNERPPQESYRLSGNPPADAPPKDNVIALPSRSEQIAERPADPVARGVFDIKLADRTFETEHFLAGARAAYETIVTRLRARRPGGAEAAAVERGVRCLRPGDRRARAA